MVNEGAMRYREVIALCLVFLLTAAQTSPADAVFWQAFDFEYAQNFNMRHLVTLPVTF